MKSMALYGERKAFFDTKTSCFGIEEAVAYRLSLTCLSHKGRLLTFVTCLLNPTLTPQL